MSHSSFSAHRLYTATLFPVFMSIRFTVIHHVRSKIQWTFLILKFVQYQICWFLMSHTECAMHLWYSCWNKDVTLDKISPLIATVLDSTYGEDRRRQEPSCCTPRYPDVLDTTSTWDSFPDPVEPGWLRSARWQTDTGTGSLTWWFHCGDEPRFSVWKKGEWFSCLSNYIVHY